MTKLCRAEAHLTPNLECSPETLAAAKVAGKLAARKATELAPFGPDAKPAMTEIDIAVSDDDLHVTVEVETEIGGEACALFAAAAAAQTLTDLTKAVVQTVHPTGHVKETAAAPPYPRKPVAAMPARVRATPTTLMGEVVGPKSPAAHTDRREAFRSFMSGNNLHITDWCRQAGIPVGVIYSFLTGRSIAIPSDAAEKLAQAAGVRVEDMFRG